MKFKTGDERKTFGIDHPEPLLYFALSSGSHSDPAVIHLLRSLSSISSTCDLIAHILEYCLSIQHT